MRHHEAQRHGGMVEHGRAHGSMAMQIDIVLHRAGEFGARRLGGCFFLLAALAGAARFLA
ncbi:hypothetical protein X759_30175 [Mesorhizobium sp. LSHC420B00]|uniref:hypothetical protein n=1 Tax=Mesorhizobium sp. LSHC420B00 TaxID=1287292 RepID=UPI0003CF7CB3|nr:hypothetical protein [Mesorhizobium sp. LSHC420B00]ESX64766.1 hypothetical protein X759_30175 [Mesorhizobium sp. LSHC420B00]